PTALAGGLPARLEGDGRLRLQVRPGTFEVRLDARAADVLNEIPVPRPVSHLPGTEIWSYRGNDRLRVATPEGLAPVDPEQVDVPPELGTLPAFRAEAGQVLTLVEQSRGRAGGGDRLELARVLWRDFDGSGFTFGDRLTGRLDDHWRLDMALPYRLGSAAEHGDNLLVTAGPGEGLTGVELRTQELMLEAFGRLEARGAVPASGWQARLDGLRTELYLPPGEKLLAAAGAGRALAAARSLPRADRDARGRAPVRAPGGRGGARRAGALLARARRAALGMAECARRVRAGARGAARPPAACRAGVPGVERGGPRRAAGAVSRRPAPRRDSSAARAAGGASRRAVRRGRQSPRSGTGTGPGRRRARRPAGGDAGRGRRAGHDARQRSALR